MFINKKSPGIRRSWYPYPAGIRYEIESIRSIVLDYFDAGKH